jgi:hypothetical protein
LGISVRRIVKPQKQLLGASLPDPFNRLYGIDKQALAGTDQLLCREIHPVKESYIDRHPSFFERRLVAQQGSQPRASSPRKVVPRFRKTLLH